MIGVLGRGAIFASVVNAIAMLINLGLQVLFARILGAEALGQYAFALSWLCIAVLLGVGGADAIVLREVAALNAHGQLAKIKALIAWSSRRILLQSLGVAALIMLVAEFLDSRIALLVWSGALLVPIWALTINRQAICRGFKMIAGARIPEVILRPLVQALLLIGFVYVLQVSPSSDLMMFCHLGGSIFALFLGWRVFRAPLPANLELDAADAGWSRGTGRLLMVALLMVLWSEVDKIFLGFFRSFDQVGIYSIASRLATLSLFGVEAVGIIAGPLVAEYAAHKDRRDLERLLGRIALILFLVTLPLCLVLVIGGPWILPYFGEHFSKAYVPLIILCVGNALSAILLTGGFALVNSGKDSELLSVTAKSCVVLIVCVLLGSMLLGMYGAAIGTAVGSITRGWMLHKKAIESLGVRISVKCALRDMCTRL